MSRVIRVQSSHKLRMSGDLGDGKMLEIVRIHACDKIAEGLLVEVRAQWGKGRKEAIRGLRVHGIRTGKSFREYTREPIRMSHCYTACPELAVARIGPAGRVGH